MASINSLMSSSSSSSIHGNSNIISGLASGMDTESMIENAVSGIKDRIAGLNQDREMLEWEQNAYRSIIDKLSDFNDKYLSYTSSTNLLSASFFNNAITASATGTYANMVSATGTTSSDFKILSATAATAATYSGIGETLKDKEVSTQKTLSELGLSGGDLTVTLRDGTTKRITVEDTDTLSSVLSKMKSELGINATYSSVTGEFYLKSAETGAANSFTLGGSLATALFGDGATTESVGTDATMKLAINGTEKELTQASNIFDIDGMKVTLKGDIAETDAANAISFSSAVDSDKIVKVIKEMIDDYNTMANEIKEQYSTKPLRDSKGKRYEPLLAEDAEDMSESAIEKYEKKAKTGILFGDSDLSSLYDELRSAISSLDLEAIGIKTEYKSGKTTLALDEEKLRSVLENDPTKVRDTLIQSKSSGAAKDGALTKIQTTIDKYAKTSGASRGILVNLAGSEKSPLSLNNNIYKDKFSNLEEQIARWEEKLSTKIDYYTKQFTALEKMISNMNSQSSALAGLMGY